MLVAIAFVITLPAIAARPSVTSKNLKKSITVNYTNDGFTPKNIAAAPGDTIIFVNRSNINMRPASLLAGVDSKKPIRPGGKFSFVLKKEGNIEYQNTLNPIHTGSILVCVAANQICAMKYMK